MIVPENVVHAFIYPVTITSVFANLTLIHIILTRHNEHVGAYRFLLMAFSVVDILISIVHIMVVPSIEMTEFGFIFYGFRFIRESTAIGVTTDMIFIALFYQTFVLLAFHYIYRYVLLCNPSWLSVLRYNNPWRNWITIAIIVDILYVGSFLMNIKISAMPNDPTREAFAPMLMEHYSIDLLAPNKPGYLGLAYRLKQADGSVVWIPQNVIIIIIVILIFFASGLVIMFCIWKVKVEMANSVSKETQGTKFQHSSRCSHSTDAESAVSHSADSGKNYILKRTLVPTVTSYIPLGMNFLCPLAGISLGGFGTVVMMSTALFPLIDPFLVIFLVTGYRPKLPSSVGNMATSTVQPANAPRVGNRA